MLLVLLIGLPTGLALLLQGGSAGSIHAPTGSEFSRIILRWFHFLAGITWIGLLYFFNLVNVGVMKALDGPTKGKVIPELMPRALFWFRWGALITVLAGLSYYSMFILAADARNAGLSSGGFLLKWLAWAIIAWGLMYAVLQPVSGAFNKGPVLAVAIGAIMVLMSVMIIRTFSVITPTGPAFSNKTLSIGIGGAMGITMLLNVWGIIWPHQKRIIAWTKENAEKGTPIPPESAKLARRAFFASRANTWLSLPMLFFMATSHGDYIWWR